MHRGWPVGGVRDLGGHGSYRLRWFPSVRTGALPLSTTTRTGLWVVIAGLFVVGFIGLFAVGGDDGDTDEQATPTTVQSTPTTVSETTVTTAASGLASVPTTLGQTAPTTAAPTTTAPAPTSTTQTTASAGSGLGTGGTGDVADGTVPIAETGGLPLAGPGLVALAAATVLAIVNRRARPRD